MPKVAPPFLVRFLALHAASGFGMAGFFVILLLKADPGGIGVLISHAEGRPWPALLLWYFCGLTFASLQMGAAIMSLETEAATDPSKSSGR